MSVLCCVGVTLADRRQLLLGAAAAVCSRGCDCKGTWASLGLEGRAAASMELEAVLLPLSSGCHTGGGLWKPNRVALELQLEKRASWGNAHCSSGIGF